MFHYEPSILGTSISGNLQMDDKSMNGWENSLYFVFANVYFLDLFGIVLFTQGWCIMVPSSYMFIHFPAQCLSPETAVAWQVWHASRCAVFRISHSFCLLHWFHVLSVIYDLSGSHQRRLTRVPPAISKHQLQLPTSKKHNLHHTSSLIPIHSTDTNFMSYDLGSAQDVARLLSSN